MPFSERDWFWFGRGGRPDKSLTCWKEREKAVFGVVGGAGVRFASLPLNDDARLFVEDAPPF